MENRSLDVSELYRPSVLLTSLLIASVVTFVLAILICNKDFKTPFSWNDTRRNAPAIILLSLLATVPMAVFSNCLTEILNLPDTMSDHFKLMSESHGALWVMALIGPFAEEVCFRHGITGSLLQQRGCRPWWAIVASAVVFGLIHMNPAQIVGATILGIYFGWLYAGTLSIWPSLLCHVLNNATAVILLQNLSADFTIGEMLPGRWAMFLLMGGCVLLAALLVLPLKKILE